MPKVRAFYKSKIPEISLALRKPIVATAYLTPAQVQLAEERAAVETPQFWERIITNFIERVLVPELVRRFEEKSDARRKEHVLEIEKPRKTQVSGEIKVQERRARRAAEISRRTSDIAKLYPRGFTALKNLLKKQAPIEIRGGEVRGGIGPWEEILRLKLSDFSPRRGQTELDNWFFAVEWGTGTVEKTTRPRLTGRTKAKDPVGAWYAGPVKYLGQKGFNLIFEPQTFTYQQWIKTIIQETFLEFVQKELRLGTGIGL
jgi:hypothetical protein